ncbi:GrpB family protein [Geobacillus sp. TFV-3]|uniref:GrpB family protein n=1 Tax=Geobacillus sp. TFV-3 TaxID=1897059 RepID=UPI00135C9860|nr:GrpB family protein [Geobacillus sp. TFV-3]KAF0996079.1 hypothetical protein BJQ97_02742 [Geobacillus sp. TFV-3]
MRKVEVIPYQLQWVALFEQEAERYGNLKEKLASQFPYDIDSYIKGKEPLVLE